MQTWKKYRLLAALGVMLVFFLCCSDKAYAAQGNVYYGSESYTWYVGESCPIGVYINSDSVIQAYEICVEFDNTMLRYLDGASVVDGKYLYLHGGGAEASYMHKLHFEPLMEGNTAFHVVSVNAVTPVNEVNLQPQIAIQALPAAPVEILMPVSNKLEKLYIDGTMPEDFSPEKYEYELSVGAEIENLSVTYETIDGEAVVYMSDTVLEYGENTIRLYVRGSADKETEYLLHIFRSEEFSIQYQESVQAEEKSEEQINIEETLPEVNTPVEEETQESEEKTETDTKKPIMTSTIVTNGETEPESDTNRIFENLILWIAVAITVVLLFLYLIWYLKGSGERKRLQKDEMEKKREIKVINLEQTVVKVDHVTMRFRQAKDEASSLKEYLIRALKRQNQYSYLTALNDVSFEIKQGDVVGIIGTNGSGKSTLLKIISGALQPTEGHVDTDRRKIQILTLGTGFDMELTAKENVYLNGAIIGYSKEYIDEKYDDIVAFAELEGFMEERMKNFSSGMVSRLGFAIATMQDTPEILILDEVLAVGDMFFRSKSEARIKEMIHSGATVLIVSHSLDVITKNCDKVVWIEKGVLQMVGKPEEVCAAYKRQGQQ